MNLEAEARRARDVVRAMLIDRAVDGTGVLDRVDIFEDDRFRFVVGQVGVVRAGVPLPVERIDTVLMNGEWVVRQVRRDLEPIGWITLT